ncbi:MAG: T9SS type A sorting domain-containing protein, partial [Bacteroidota bacterium]
VGICRVWGWNYRGLGDPIVGDPISTLMDDSCEDVSDEFITVIRESDCPDVDGGMITLDNGETSTSICVDGVADPLNINVTGSQGPRFAWIITDDLNNVLALPDAPPFDLDGAGAGVCRIWYLRFDRTVEGLEEGSNISDLEGCFDISNFVEVIREIPDGGTVTLLDGSTTYTGTAGDIVFQVQHTTTAPNLSYWYIITDDNDNILDWLNSANGNTLNLSGAPAGECRIRGWNYRGLGDPIVGDPISSLMDDSCEDVSDEFITVIREEPNIEGGDLKLDVSVNNLLYRQYSRVTYTLSITNEGTEDMTQVAVSTPFPEGMRYTGSRPSKGNYRQVAQEWKVRNLAAGETATLELTLFTLVGDQEIEFFAEVSNAFEADIDSTPNNGTNGEDDEASITIMPLENGGFGSNEGNTDLELSISADVDAYTIYEPITFFVELTNNGDDRAETILVDASLPEGFVFTSANATHGRYRLFMQRWFVEELGVGETATLELTLFPLITGQEITNFVEVHTQLQVDMDSTPANGDGVTPREDDEAAITLNSTNRNNSASNIIVDPRSFEGTSVVVDQIYPNPTVEIVNLELVSLEIADTEVQIINQYGQILQSVPTQIDRGHNRLQINVTDLPTGNYYLMIRGLEGFNSTRPFVKVR